ncbi:MAG: pitrilysin family protein [Pseudomonadota bacterium]|nr:pitrilysin family protein [Pseudomonadota bacterium]
MAQRIVASLAFVFLELFSGLCFSAPEKPPENQLQLKLAVEKFKLNNGLNVLLYEDHSVPLVSYHTWFRVGSKNEKPGLTGMAHLFEHMMFKGTAKYPAERFDQILQANGAVNNAFTSNDYTGYYIDAPSDKLEVLMDLESDRMTHLEVTEANLKSEREVVKEERRMRTENSIQGTLFELIFGAVFKVHPYKWPVVGWMEDLNRMKVSDCIAFYKKFYAPNNATLVIAGDISISKTKALVEKFYGSLPASTTLEKSEYQVEPLQRGERARQISKEVQTPTIGVTFKTSKAGTDDAYALDLLSNILGAGESSRLHRRLVYKEQKALSMQAFNYTLQDDGIFGIITSLRSGIKEDPVLQGIFGEIWRVKQILISEEELQKAKNSVMTDYVNSLKTIHGKGNIIAMNETLFGDYQMFFKDLDKYNAVTREKIQTVAEQYLKPEQRSIVRIYPK